MRQSAAASRPKAAHAGKTFSAPVEPPRWHVSKIVHQNKKADADGRCHQSRQNNHKE
jgi:hypothetical protein